MYTGDSLSDSLVGKRIVIVGCSQGHGSSIAVGCANLGAEVLLVDRNNAVNDICNRIRDDGGKAESYLADVLDAETIKNALSVLSGKTGIDGILYFPRARVRKDMLDISQDDWDLDLNIALRGAFFTVQAAVEHFKKAPCKPFIITFSSILAEFVGNESAGYHSAKGGLESLTRYLAVNLGPKAIRVNAIQMGWIIKDADLEKFNSTTNHHYRTSAEQAHPLKKVGTAQDLLNAVEFLATEKSAFITGQILRIDGGLTIQEQTHLFSKMQMALE